ncbi:hypothetical protein TAL182_CH02132 [Rhizobium sp. TAL182]|nr:hypothetical protein TAL182_CH02132 [Rhizobium sp. TAL182]
MSAGLSGAALREAIAVPVHLAIFDAVEWSAGQAPKAPALDRRRYRGIANCFWLWQ